MIDGVMGQSACMLLSKNMKVWCIIIDAVIMWVIPADTYQHGACIVRGDVRSSGGIQLAENNWQNSMSLKYKYDYCDAV